MTESSVLLQKIKGIITQLEPSATIYLYGSQARGDSHNNSDWDLLILLDTIKVNIETERRITYPLYELEFETGEIISPMIYSSSEWNSKYKFTPYYQNVVNDGIKL